MDWSANFIPFNDKENEETKPKKRVLTTTTARQLSMRLKLNHLRVKLDEERCQVKELQAKNGDLEKEIETLQLEKNNLLEKVNFALALYNGAQESSDHLKERLDRVQSQRLQEKITAHGALKRFSAIIEQLKSKNMLHIIEFDEI